MKRFFRTAAGKAVLILVCVISILTFAACAAGAALTVSAEDGRISLRTQDETMEWVLGSDLRDKAIGILFSFLNDKGMPYDDQYVYEIIREDGRSWVSDPGTIVDTRHSYQIYVKYDLNGVPIGYLTKIQMEKETDSSVFYRVFTVNVGIRQTNSGFRIMSDFIRIICQLCWWIFVIGFAALLLSVLSFVSLMKVSARRPDREELVPGPFHAVPYDLLLAFGAAALIAIVYFFGWIVPIDDRTELNLTVGAAVLGLLILIGLSMSAAARIKTKTLIRNTLIFRILKLLVGKPLAWLWKGLKKLHAFNLQILRGLPLVWKTAVVMGIMALVFSALEGLIGNSGPVFVFSLVKYMILIPIVLYFAVCLRRLQKGGEALAAGDLSYQTETKGLPHDLKKHAENLNSIAGGMVAAVREQMKSERMKTELITNVSHDLKTPLTSLVNYAGLIAKEPSENPKITEYSEVLLRQSERMKRLIDDLVEASKASTGDMDVELVPCDARVLLSQAAGEYEARLAAAGLTLVTRGPEQEVRIMADGRRMWRVFDNLLNNIVKYALSGTRVYLDLETDGKDVVITFRNTSREPLAADVEELTERFTRGDPSRNTEGSGLGLAIAKSLTELQGGKLSLTADGDLFKAVLRFPLA